MKIEDVPDGVKVSFESGCIVVSSRKLTDAKKFLIKYISDEFDKTVRDKFENTYPYVIGDKTFYSKKELENWIISKQ